MPLNATFVADFSSFLDATRKSVDATNELTAAAQKTGPAFDIFAADAAKAAQEAETAAKEQQARALEFGRAIGENIKELASVSKEFVMGYIDEFAGAEQATARLNQALKNSNQTGATETYRELAESMQRMSTFSTTAITNAETLLTTIGNIKPDNMEATLQAAMDLAAGMSAQGHQMSLEQATLLVAKAAATGGDSLGRLKAVLGDSLKDGAKFADVMEAINKKFGGSAAAALDTTTGKIEQLKNTMGDFNEKVGKVFAETLGKMIDLFNGLPKGVQEAIIIIGSLAVALAPVLVSLSSLVALLSTPLAAAVGAGIAAGFAALLPFIGVGGLIVGGLVAVYTAFKHWDDIALGFKVAWQLIVEGFKWLVQWIGDTDKSVQNFVASVEAWLIGKLVGIFERTFGAVKTFTSNVIGSFQKMYDVLVGHSIIPDMMSLIAGHFDALESIMVQPAVEACDEVVTAFEGLTVAFAGVTASFSQLPAGVSSLFGQILSTPGGTLAMTGSGALAAPVYTGFGAGGSKLFDLAPSARPGNDMTTPWGGTINITMNGMFGADDPQTRAAVRDVVSDALMDGMRSTRLMGTT